MQPNRPLSVPALLASVSLAASVAGAQQASVVVPLDRFIQHPAEAKGERPRDLGAIRFGLGRMAAGVDHIRLEDLHFTGEGVELHLDRGGPENKP